MNMQNKTSAEANSLSLRGRTAIVTGAGQNIGKAIALKLGAQGANVVVCGHKNLANVEAVVESLRASGSGAMAALLDIGDSDQVASTVEQTVANFGSVDIIVANAAIRPHQPFLEITDSDWQKVINTNLSSAFFLARAALPHMCRNKWGRVIHISGRDGFMADVSRAHNVTCKAGLHGLTKAIAVEFGAQGVTANTVAPGPIDTKRILDNYPGLEEMQRYWISQMPLGRMGTVEDVANVCGFLASGSAAFVTGALVHLSGGWIMS